MQLSSLLLTAVVGLAGFQGIPQGSSIVIDHPCVVQLIEEVKLPADLPSQEAGVLTTLRPAVMTDLPSQEAGVLTRTPVIGADGKVLFLEERVRAGMEVKKGDVLGQIDSQMAQKMKEIAEFKLAIAVMERENKVSVKYAEKAHEVAIADYDTAVEANLLVSGTITRTELRRLYLLCEQFQLQTEQALYELGIAAISVDAQQAQLEAAEHDLKRRLITSPINGEIIEVYPHEGEWLRPGDPIVHIVGMDQLWVEGRLESTLYSPANVKGREVDVIATSPGMKPRVLPGTIDFVSPIVDGDKRFKVRAIVDNERDDKSRQWLLRPGMETVMTIK